MRFFFPLTYFPEPELQSIEVASSFQIPSFQIVGLPGPEVNESKERVRAAIEASQLEFPRRRVVINLAPASIRKRGTGSDLAMALAVLAHRSLDDDDRRVAAWAELGLDGATKPCSHPTRALYAASKSGVSWLLHAPDDGPALRDAAELLSRNGMASPERVPVRTLAEAWEWVREGSRTAPGASAALSTTTQWPSEETPSSLPVPQTLAEVLGPALAGFHSLLLLGPRGTGKTLALEQATACFPQVSGAAGLLRRMSWELAPDESEDGSACAVRVGPEVRPAGLLGGWSASAFRPGAFARAHEGILLADELLEWSRDSREALRGPLDQGAYTLHRREGVIAVRSRFLLLGTGNLCPCGGTPPDLMPRASEALLTACRCTLTSREAYLGRLSGPILDRIDLAHLMIPRGRGLERSIPLGELQARILSCRERLLQRWSGLPGLLSAMRLEQMLAEQPGLRDALDEGSYPSLRSRHKTLRIALTLSEWLGAGTSVADCVWRAEPLRPEKILGR